MTLVIDTTLTPEEREEWHRRLLDRENWARLRDLCDRMIEGIDRRTVPSGELY